MKRLIVTADDFGLTGSVNRGIIKAYKEGIVTYLNLIPTGEAFEEAVGLLRENGIEEVGAHLALTETYPAADPERIRSLVGKDGRFCAHNPELFFKLAFKKIDRSQIYTELRAQLAAITGQGVRVTCLSGHEHVHMMPGVLEVFLRLAGENSIRSIRYPGGERPSGIIGPSGLYKAAVLRVFSGAMARAADGAGLGRTGGFAGFYDSGKLDESALLRIIDSVGEGTTELVCHPGFLGPEILDRYRFHIRCEEELYGLTGRRARAALERNNISLATFGAIQAPGA